MVIFFDKLPYPSCSAKIPDFSKDLSTYSVFIRRILYSYVKQGSEQASVQTSERDGRGEMTAHHHSASQPAAYYDPTIDDISEIKMELDPDHISPKDTPPSYHPKHGMSVCV